MISASSQVSGRATRPCSRKLVNRYNGSLVRVAMRYVLSRAVAEEVVQDTWIGVIEGIDRFEGRSTLKTWLYEILIYRARARGVART